MVGWFVETHCQYSSVLYVCNRYEVRRCVCLLALQCFSVHLDLMVCSRLFISWKGSGMARCFRGELDWIEWKFGGGGWGMER